MGDTRATYRTQAPRRRRRAWSVVADSLRALAPCLLAAFPASVGAQETDSPGTVEVGFWLNDIHSVDFRDGSFAAEFYMWWITPDEAFQPFEQFQVLNGRGWDVRAVSRRVLPDGRAYTAGYVSVTINHHWDLRYYPFDRQRLRLVFETPFTASEMRLVPDRDGSLVSDFAGVEGFRIVDFRLDEHVERYDTDFGIGDGAGHSFSRLVAEIDLERQSRRIVVVIFVGFLVANLMALLTYAVHVSMLSIRCSMSAGALFGAVGNMYFLQRAVHPAAGSLIVDRIAVVTFGGIVVALLAGIIVDRLYRLERVGLARIVNWSIFAVVFIASVGYLGLAFQEAAAA